mgnify:CR=1 FL=1
MEGKQNIQDSSKRNIELLRAEMLSVESQKQAGRTHGVVALEIKNPEVTRTYIQVPDNLFSYLREHTKKE